MKNISVLHDVNAAEGLAKLGWEGGVEFLLFIIGGQNAACKFDKPRNSTRSTLVRRRGSEPPKPSKAEEQKEGLPNGARRAGVGVVCPVSACSAAAAELHTCAYLCWITVRFLLFLLYLF